MPGQAQLCGTKAQPLDLAVGHEAEAAGGAVPRLRRQLRQLSQPRLPQDVPEDGGAQRRGADPSGLQNPGRVLNANSREDLWTFLGPSTSWKNFQTLSTLAERDKW